MEFDGRPFFAHSGETVKVKSFLETLFLMMRNPAPPAAGLNT